MSITVKPTHPDFVTEISGVDLAQPLSPADRDAIEAAINRYAIVVFHGPDAHRRPADRLCAEFRPDRFLGAEGATHRHQTSHRTRTTSPTSPISTATATCSSSTQAPARLAGQSPVAHRRLVPRRAGRAVDALCPCRARRRRRHGIRRPARRLRRAAGQDQEAARGADRRAFDLAFARPARRHHLHAGRARQPAAGAAARGAHASRLGPQDALCRRARLAHRSACRSPTADCC